VEETHARFAAIFGRCEYGTDQKRQTNVALMVGTDTMADKVFQITVDFAHQPLALQPIAVDPLNTPADSYLTHIIETEVAIEQANEGAEHGRRIVVLCPVSQQFSPFDVERFHIIGRSGAHYRI